MGVLVERDVQDGSDEKQAGNYDGGVKKALFNATLGPEDFSGSAER